MQLPIGKMFFPIKGDSRYSISRCYRGRKSADYVVYFCGESIGAGATMSDAQMIALSHADARERALSAP